MPDTGPSYCAQPRCQTLKPKLPASRSRRTRGRKGQAMRAAVLQRDGQQCKWPGCTETQGLEVHHLERVADRPDRADDLANQVTLCKTHHLEAAAAYAADRRRRRS